MAQQPEVRDIPAHLREPIRAEPEGKAAVHVRIHTTVLQHDRVHHPGTAELEPPFAAAGATSARVALGARDVDLCAWLCEREVMRPKSRGPIGPEIPVD